MNKKQRSTKIDDRIRVAYKLRTLICVPRDLFYQSIWLWPAPKAPPIEWFIEFAKAWKPLPIPDYIDPLFILTYDYGGTRIFLKGYVSLYPGDRKMLCGCCVSCALDPRPQNMISGYLYCDSCADWLKENP